MKRLEIQISFFTPYNVKRSELHFEACETFHGHPQSYATAFQDGAPIQRAILGGALEWKGILRVPPQTGCPQVCPPWAHRSYATEERLV